MVDPLHEKLQRLGIPGYEARAYVTLLQSGRPMNGYEVAKASGVPRSTIYETLTKLARRGIAFEVRAESGPVQYVPLPVDALLTRLRSDFDDAIDELERGLSDIGTPADAGLVHHVRGWEAVLRRAEDVVQGARTSLHISAWPDHLSRLEPTLEAAESRGVDIWICAWGGAEIDIGNVFPNPLTTPESAVDRTEWVLSRIGCKLLVVVGDRRMLLTAGTTERDIWGVYTEDPAVVLLGYEAIVHYLVSDVLIGAFGPEKFLELWEADAQLMRLGTGLGRRRTRSGAKGP